MIRCNLYPICYLLCWIRTNLIWFFSYNGQMIIFISLKHFFLSFGICLNPGWFWYQSWSEEIRSSFFNFGRLPDHCWCVNSALLLLWRLRYDVVVAFPHRLFTMKWLQMLISNLFPTLFMFFFLRIHAYF